LEIKLNFFLVPIMVDNLPPIKSFIFNLEYHGLSLTILVWFIRGSL
jgi:hypothetical protein